jgi:hypothetical protein
MIQDLLSLIFHIHEQFVAREKTALSLAKTLLENVYTKQ